MLPQIGRTVTKVDEVAVDMWKSCGGQWRNSGQRMGREALSVKSEGKGCR